MTGQPDKPSLAYLFAAALRKRDENSGRHLHHRDCIHNLPPEQQVAMRGKTTEWWTRIIGPLPVQMACQRTGRLLGHATSCPAGFAGTGGRPGTHPAFS